MRVLEGRRKPLITHHAGVLNGHLANKVLSVGIVLGSETQLCEGGTGSDGSYGAGERTCRGESAGEHLEGRQWTVEKEGRRRAYVVMCGFSNLQSPRTVSSNRYALRSSACSRVLAG